MWAWRGATGAMRTCSQEDQGGAPAVWRSTRWTARSCSTNVSVIGRHQRSSGEHQTHADRRRESVVTPIGGPTA
eukprot:1814445-Alexandrium_andersonii.AAC.1